MMAICRFARGAMIGLALTASATRAQVVAGDKDISLSGMMQTAVGHEKSSFAELGVGFEYFQTRRLAWRLEVGASVQAHHQGLHAAAGDQQND